MTALLRDWVVDPVSLMFLLSLAGLLLLARHGVSTPGVLLAVVWIAAVLLMTAPRSVNPLLARLEQQVVAGQDCPPDLPIVVLGGGVDSRARLPDDFERMSPATLARLAAALREAEARPDAPIILSGGAHDVVSEAEVMAKFLWRLGIDETRFHLEAESRNTADNAAAVARLVARESLSPHIQLVTSALHMPRAMAVFERNGFTVCALPVDYQAIDDIPAYAWMPQTTALRKFDALLHEWVGTLIYRWTGRL